MASFNLLYGPSVFYSANDQLCFIWRGKDRDWSVSLTKCVAMVTLCVATENVIGLYMIEELKTRLLSQRPYQGMEAVVC